MLVATTWYFNDEFGNISRVVANQAGTSVYAATGASGMDYVSTCQLETGDHAFLRGPRFS